MNQSYAKMGTAEVMEVDGETLILNPETFAVTKLNETAGRIWEWLGEEASIDHLAEKMCAEFMGAEGESIQQDLVHFLGQLEEIGLVRRA